MQLFHYLQNLRLARQLHQQIFGHNGDGEIDANGDEFGWDAQTADLANI